MSHNLLGYERPLFYIHHRDVAVSHLNESGDGETLFVSPR